MFCSQFGTNLAPMPWIIIIAQFFFRASTYNEDAMPMIYWNVPYRDILFTVENLKNL